MGLSFGHILLLLIVILVLFGAGKLPGVMGDLGKGLRNFKDGLKGTDEKPTDNAADKHKAE
jgi:sec-independent protein translocase protein TatA